MPGLQTQKSTEKVKATQAIGSPQRAGSHRNPASACSCVPPAAARLPPCRAHCPEGHPGRAPLTAHCHPIPVYCRTRPWWLPRPACGWGNGPPPQENTSLSGPQLYRTGNHTPNARGWVSIVRAPQLLVHAGVRTGGDGSLLSPQPVLASCCVSL